MNGISAKELEQVALISIKEGKIKKAEKILEKILQLNQSNTKVLNLLGLCKYSYCRFQAAYKIWTRSYEIDNNLKAKEYLGKYNTGDEQEMQQLFNMALYKIKAKKYEDAKIDLENVLTMNNGLIPPKILIANITTGTNKIKKIYRVLEFYSLDSSNINHLKINIRALEHLLDLTTKSEIKTITFLVCLLWAVVIVFIVILTVL